MFINWWRKRCLRKERIGHGVLRVCTESSCDPGLTEESTQPGLWAGNRGAVRSQGSICLTHNAEDQAKSRLVEGWKSEDSHRK